MVLKVWLVQIIQKQHLLLQYSPIFPVDLLFSATHENGIYNKYPSFSHHINLINYNYLLILTLGGASLLTAANAA